MESVKNRGRAGGCAWVVAWVLTALILATGGTLFGSGRSIGIWRVCHSQDHEPNPDAATGVLSVWVVMVTVLLLLGWVLDSLPRSRWYLLPVMVVVTAALTWLYVTGMGAPAPLQPGEDPVDVCRTMPTFPFID